MTVSIDASAIPQRFFNCLAQSDAADLAPIAGRRLSELAEAWSVPPRTPSAEAESTFDHRARHVTSFEGDFRTIGEIEADGAGPDHVLVFHDKSTLAALSGDNQEELLWQRFLPHTDAPLSWKYRFGTTRGRGPSVLSGVKVAGMRSWR